MTLRPFSVYVLSAALVALTGCASTQERQRSEAIYKPRPAMTYAQQSSQTYADPAAMPLQPETAEAEQGSGSRSVQPGSGRFINEQAAINPPQLEGKAGDVTFNFEGQPVNAVIKAILGDYLQQNYVIAPGVQGTVTFSTAKPMRRDQVMSILEMLLRWNNATLVWDDGRYTILPVDKAMAGNLIPGVGKPNNMGYQVRAVPLKFISATEMEKLLKPYSRSDAVVSTDNARSMIVLAGTPAELNNYLQTVEIFDVDWLEGMSVGIFPMRQIEAAKVVGELEKVFGASSDTPMAGLFRFMPLEGINSVMVITPQPKYLRTAEEWLRKLDQGGGGGGQRLYVYEVKNVKASDLADTLSDVFGSGGGRSSGNSNSNVVAPGLEPVSIRSSGVNRGTRNNSSRNNNYQKNAADSGATAKSGGEAKSGGLRVSDISPNVDTPDQQGGGNVQPAAPQVSAARDNGNGGGTETVGIAIGESEEVRISAVDESNSLLVRATAAEWQSIEHVIERLDQIPLQVQIEAQIISVKLKDELSYGVKWYFDNAVSNSDFVEQAGGLASEEVLAISRLRRSLASVAGSAPGTGIGWTFIGNDMGAVLSALDAVGKTEVRSAPSLVVLNNKQASINVGTQIPVSTTNINPANGGGVGTYQSFQYLQTGITLDVTPRVNPGGLVFMEIQQDDSSPGLGSTNGGNVPIDQQTISTEVAVQSGDTVLLGGLIKQTDSSAKSGVPFLSRIPVFGALFGSQNRKNNREELIVLIRPTVIYNQEDARRITEDYRNQFQGLEPLRVRVDTE